MRTAVPWVRVGERVEEHAPRMSIARASPAAAARPDTTRLSHNRATSWDAVRTQSTVRRAPSAARPVRGRGPRCPRFTVIRSPRPAASHATPAPEHFSNCDGGLGLVAEVASDAVLLLVVEEAQWLDGPTSDALTFCCSADRCRRCTIGDG